MTQVIMYRPTEKHFDMLEWFYTDFLKAAVELNEFTEKYPGVTRQQLARICNCSIDTVNRWFVAKEKTRLTPSSDHKLRMSIAHYVWSRDALDPPQFSEYRKMWDEFGKDIIKPKTPKNNK